MTCMLVFVHVVSKHEHGSQKEAHHTYFYSIWKFKLRMEVGNTCTELSKLGFKEPIN